ncbi:MAG TPA: AsmA-like C-terminal region-containing protein [Chthoniobacterales bacterium]
MKSPRLLVGITMPSTLATEPPRPRLHRGRLRASGTRRTLRALLRLTIVLVLAGLALGGWYLARKGFSRSWRNLVVEELHKRGVEVSVRRLTLDPFRGLIARDVRIFDYKKRERTLAVVSEISLDINYAALFEHQPFLNAIDIRNGDLTIPLPAAAGLVSDAEIKQFRAHVYFPPERIEVSQAEGVFCGIRISASGQLIKRENYQPSVRPPAEDMAARLRLLQTLVTTLQRLRYPVAPPELQVKFSGDLSQLEDAHVEANLHASEVVRGKYTAKQLSLTTEWKDQTLSIPQIDWRDSTGRFSGTADWFRRSGHATFQARSTIDLPALLGGFGFGTMLSDFTFQTPPLVEASGWAVIGAPKRTFEVIGKITLDDFSYKTIDFDGLTADFAWDRTRMMVRNFQLRQPSGQLHADLFEAPNDFRLNLESTIAPTALASIAPTSIGNFLRQWEWQRSPSIRVNILGQSRNPATWRGSGSFVLGPARFRGVHLNSASGNIRFGDGAFTIDDFHLTRSEGTASGAFGYDSHRREIEINHVQTTLTPSDAIMWIEPKFWRQVAPYRFHRPPQIMANGIVQLGKGKQTHLQLDVNAPAGMDYTFIDKVLPFDHVAGTLLFTDDRLQIFGLKATLFSGSVTGNADISLGDHGGNYTATLAVEGADFPSLTDLYFKYKTSRGELSGKLDFGGHGTDRAALYGTGEVDIKNGNVFAIPVFGPLSVLVNKIFSGAGYSVAHEAKAPFTIHDGAIHIDRLKVAGRLFSMLGHGDINFIKNALDFDIRIDANGPGAVLAPLYQLFEYHGSGSLTNPTWRPKHL